MARVKTYDPKKVKVLFGSLILTGVDEGTFINVETQGDGISAIVGCDQEIVRSIDPSSVLKQVTVTLLQSSSSNAALSLIQDADNQNGAALLPMLAVKTPFLSMVANSAPSTMLHSTLAIVAKTGVTHAFRCRVV